MERVALLDVGRNANPLTNRPAFDRKGTEMDQLLQALQPLQQQGHRHFMSIILRKDAELD
jgi:hypothetical protein